MSREKIADPLNAFCVDSDAYIEGAEQGPLAGLTFAAKDIFDVAGHVTGAGNPDWKANHESARSSAWAVQALVDVGATMVGKTLTDELTLGIFGENAHYGTPINPRAPGRVPGGSSSGSASAVAGNLVDFALGSDTGGSVRVPASFCGLYGIRSTHGRIPRDGMLPQAPSYDTIGWFARDINVFSRVGRVLLRDESAQVPQHHLILAEDAFELADPVVTDALGGVVETLSSLVNDTKKERLASTHLTDWSHQQGVLQVREAWETARDWVDRVNPRLSYRVAAKYTRGSKITEEEVQVAQSDRRVIIERMNELLTEGVLICLPTTPTPAPPVGESLSTREAIEPRLWALVGIASTIGAPQINLPYAEVDGLPVGLSLIGPKGSDQMLIDFACKAAVALEPAAAT
jgi:amidase